MKRLLTGVLAFTLVTSLGGAAAAAASGSGVAIRVDQTGYATGEAKRAYLLSPAPAPGTRFAVRDKRGHTVLTGTVAVSAGGWKAGYTAVHPIDFGRLRTSGTYTIRAGGAVSP